MSEPVPLHVIAGFLGTGKTTLVLDQVSRRRDGERVAVIVNDFGKAGFDGTRIGGEGGVAVQEIPGGCICCTAPEGFPAAVRAILDEIRPDRIFVEPTGLARPADLVDTLRRGETASRLALGAVVVLVDPATLDPDAAQAIPLMRAQIEAADVLVANRCDLANEEQLDRFRAWSAGLWPAPLAVLETSHGVLPDEALEISPRSPAGAAHSRSHAHAEKHAHAENQVEGHVAHSWEWSEDVIFCRDRLGDVLAALVGGGAGKVLVRMKGIFRTEEGHWRLEFAGGSVHEAPSGFRRGSRMDLVLEADGALNRSWLEDAFAGSQLSVAERTIDPEQLEVVRPDGTRRVLDRSTVLALADGVSDVSSRVPGRTGAAARMARLLAAVEVTAPAEAVVIAADGFATEPIPLSDLEPTLLLHSLPDGSALPTGKGGPFRLLVPEDAAPGGRCANVKGVVRIVLRRTDP